MVHHPYESFSSSVEEFISQAADDPKVQSIKMTLYRAGGDSAIIRSLMKAADRGKQVAVLVEIKARFDEATNVQWAKQLERAGVHVVYGMVGLKTHSKVVLVVRDDGDQLRRYVHIGTGTTTARPRAFTKTSESSPAIPTSVPMQPNCSTTSPAIAAHTTTRRCSLRRATSVANSST